MYQRYNGRGRSQGRGRSGSRGGGRYPRGNKSNHTNNSSNNSRSWGEGRVTHEELVSPPGGGGVLQIAVQGCCHGQLDQVYKAIEEEELKRGKKVDLLLCCGDFQSLRNIADLASMAVPDKYKEIGTFYKYYSGQVRAPVLTIFIGGNHEASGSLQELFYGGWVAENIYYLGCAGVVNFGGLRIAGLSGIYKDHDYKLGHYERPPYDRSTLRSVYHVRNVEVYRLQQLKRPGCDDFDSVIDIMLSHDWPRGIEQFGDTQGLLRKKQFFRSEVETNTLGSPAGEILLQTLQPKRWFAAHLHVKFEATVHHQQQHQTNVRVEPSSTSWDNITGWEATTAAVVAASEGRQSAQNINEPNDVNRESTQFIGLESSDKCCDNDALSTLSQQMTKFLALDKCLPQRNFLQIITMQRPESEVGNEPELKYDLEWLVILRKTAHLTVGAKTMVKVPVTPVEITALDRKEVLQKLNILEGRNPNFTSSYHDLRIPRNFVITASPHQEGISTSSEVRPSPMIGNPQTDQLLNVLGVQHVITVPYRSNHTTQLVKQVSTMQATAKIYRPDAVAHDRPEHDNDEIDLDEEEAVDKTFNVETTKPFEGVVDEDEISLDYDNITTDDTPEVKKPCTYGNAKE